MQNIIPGRYAAKVAFLTGAGSGIGRATALRLAAEGAEVIILGCAGMAKHVAVASEASGLPVIEPCQAAAAAAQLAVIGARVPAMSA